MAFLARARLGLGKVDDASLVAHEAYYGALEFLPAMGDTETLLRLVHAECLLAGSDIEAARQILARGRERLLERASHLGARADRRTFLERVPYNASLLSLAEDSLGPAASDTDSAQPAVHVVPGGKTNRG